MPELVAALQADIWERMLAEPSAVAAEHSSTWTHRLDRILEHWIAFEFDHHDLYHAVFHVAGAGGPEPMEQARLLLRSVLDGGTHAGEFDVADIDTTTEFLLHAYGGPCYHSTDRTRVPKHSEPCSIAPSALRPRPRKPLTTPSPRTALNSRPAVHC